MDKTKLKYKLIDHDGYTRRGMPGETYWLDGKEKVAARTGAELCTASLIHYYDDPYLATLFNPIHANIDNPRLIIIKIDKQHASDGLKGGCKKAKYTKEVKLPKISVIQKVTFAIKVSLECYKDEEFEKWAINWLNGNDRTASAAGAAASAAGAAWAAARAAEAAWAARAAAWAARAAAGAAWAAKSNRFYIKTIREVIKNGQN